MHPFEIDWSQLNQPDYLEFASQNLTTSLTKTGAVFVRNYPFKKILISALENQIKAFDLTSQQKERFRSKDGTARTGYIPFAVEVADPGAAPDPKEIWHVSRESIVANIWIEEQPEFKESIQALWSQLDTLATTFMQLIGKALGCLPYANEIMAEHNSILRMIRYSHVNDVEKYPLLAGPHRDIGLFTIHTFHSLPGYEVFLQNQWQPLTLNSDQLLISAGNMLTHISNGAFLSCEHRVKNLPNKHQHRHFSGFFVHPHPSAILKCHPLQNERAQFADVANLSLLDERARKIKISL